ncbi:uncharacterized protein LOC130676940 [Microplitis mediator]|uniref:uncharacterized protein LOC130676940 n=1 Tax=Microplitis mediator TaxID=375433 RepID=UPI0025559C3A|nr:uncharacterized protein LOC130676940 [Microplitis mediator]
MIVAFTSQNQKDWDEHLDDLKFAYNTSVHTALGVSPFYLNHGRDARLINDTDPLENLDVSDVTVWQARMDRAIELRHFVEQNMLKARERTRKQYKQKFSDTPIDLKIGDEVYHLNKKLSKKVDGYSAKLAPKYSGPAIVSKILSPLVVQLQDDAGNDIGTYYYNDLKIPRRSRRRN